MRRIVVVFVLVSGVGCAIGDRDPGCARDADCAPGFVCRAAACFRLTTPISSASAPPAGTGGAGGH